MAARLNGSGNLENGNIYADMTTVRVPADPNKFIKAENPRGQGNRRDLRQRQ